MTNLLFARPSSNIFVKTPYPLTIDSSRIVSRVSMAILYHKPFILFTFELGYLERRSCIVLGHLEYDRYRAITPELII